MSANSAENPQGFQVVWYRWWE